MMSLTVANHRKVQFKGAYPSVHLASWACINKCGPQSIQFILSQTLSTTTETNITSRYSSFKDISVF